MAKKDDAKKSPLKTSPGKKKDVEKEKAVELLLKHPEILNNARHYFNHENGKTIIEECVPRGDLKQEDQIMPRNQGDLKDEDLRDLAKYANSIIDDVISSYDSDVAKEDALTKAIWSLGNGKYQGRVNASTYSLILEEMSKKK